MIHAAVLMLVSVVCIVVLAVGHALLEDARRRPAAAPIWRPCDYSGDNPEL